MSDADVKRQDIKFTPHIIWIELGRCSTNDKRFLLFYFYTLSFIVF